MLVTGLSFHSMATGESTSHCNKYPEVTRNAWPYFTNAQCDCSSNLPSKYEYKEPSDMTLVGVCGFQKNKSGEASAGYFLRGQKAVTASATYVQGSLGGPRLYFGDWKFIEREAAFKAFNVPALTETARCWTSDATVEGIQLLIMKGNGTDEDGEWLLKYRVIKVGNYKACNADNY